MKQRVEYWVATVIVSIVAGILIGGIECDSWLNVSDYVRMVLVAPFWYASAWIEDWKLRR